jgi:uncharacterized protein YkwD
MVAMNGSRVTLDVLFLVLAGVLIVLSAERATPRLAASALCTSPRTTNDAVEAEFVALLNAYRASSGLAALTPTAGLTRAAVSKSTEIAATGVLEHDSIVDTQARFAACGNASTAIGENLAAGVADAAGVLAQWQASPPHNQNLLGAGFRTLGVARTIAATGTPYWTLELGNAQDAVLSPPGPTTTPPTPITPPVANPGPMVGLVCYAFGSFAPIVACPFGTVPHAIPPACLAQPFPVRAECQ